MKNLTGNDKLTIMILVGMAIGCEVLGVWAYGRTQYYQGRIDGRNNMMEIMTKVITDFNIKREIDKVEA